MWVLPFLYFYHSYPLPTFYSEWVAAALGLCAMPLLVTQRFWQRPEIPRIVLLPMGLMLVVWVQLALGKVGYFDQAFLFTLSMLWVALLIVLGWWLRVQLGLPMLSTVLAAFLLLGAEVSALVGVLQHYSLHTFLDAVVLHASPPATVGNMGQSNQLANYVMLGLVSLGLLHVRWRLRVWQTVFLAIPPLLVLTLSGSRSPWLYLLCMAGMSFLWQRRDKLYLPLLNYSFLLLLGFSLMHLVVQIPWLSGPAGRMTSAQRLFGGQLANYITLGFVLLGLLYSCLHLRVRQIVLLSIPLLVLGFYLTQWLSVSAVTTTSAQHFLSQAATPGESSGFSIRIYLWHGAWVIFTQSPLLGAGLGHFSWQIFQLGPVLQFANISGRVWEHAHNLVMQIAAEMGLAGLLVLLGTLTLWLWQAKNAQRSIHHWWGYGLLAVIGIHSLLEYPLWYAYFLGITAFIIGTLDNTTYRLALRGMTGRLLTAAILLLGLLSLSQLIYQYKSHNFEDVANAVVAAETAENNYVQLVRMQLIRDKLTRMREHALPLRHYAESMLAEAGWDHGADNGALNKRVMHFSPNPAVVFREAWLLAQAGRQAEAYMQLELAIWAFPNDFPVAREQLHELALEDPAHFADMLKFANRKYMEWQRETQATGKHPPA